MIAEAAPAKTSAVWTMIRGLAWDVGLPVVTFYVLYALGVSDLAALLAATAVAGLRIGWDLVRRRTLNQFATVMLVIYGVGLVLALTTGDPRTILLRSSIITASVAAIFLVTAAVGRRPLTLSAMQSFAPAQADRMTERYRTDPDVRRGFRLTSTVWGAGLLAEAIVRLPLVYLLPVEIGVGVSEALFAATIVALGAWNAWYLRSVRDHFSVG